MQSTIQPQQKMKTKNMTMKKIAAVLALALALVPVISALMRTQETHSARESRRGTVSQR